MLHLYPAGQAVILIGRILSETCTSGFKVLNAVGIPARAPVWCTGIDTVDGMDGVDCFQKSGVDSKPFAAHK